MLFIENKMRFLLEVMNDTLIIRKRKRVDIDKDLDDRKYDRQENKGKKTDFGVGLLKVWSLQVFFGGDLQNQCQESFP